MCAHSDFLGDDPNTGLLGHPPAWDGETEVGYPCNKQILGNKNKLKNQLLLSNESVPCLQEVPIRGIRAHLGLKWE